MWDAKQDWGGVMGTVYLSVWVDSFVSLFMLL